VRVHRPIALYARTAQLVARRSQRRRQLLSPTPPPGLLQLPTQFANWSSHRASVTAFADELSAPMPIKAIAKKTCRTMGKLPENDKRASLARIYPNRSRPGHARATRLKIRVRLVDRRPGRCLPAPAASATSLSSEDKPTSGGSDRSTRIY